MWDAKCSQLRACKSSALCAGRDSHGKAVASLFSPETSHVDLISSRVVDKHTIEVAWRLEGVISQLGVHALAMTANA